MNIQTALAKIPERTWVYCNRCKGDTRHESLYKSSRQEAECDEDHRPMFVETWLYLGWRCLGCDSVALEERYTCEGMHDEDGNDIWDSTFHPDRARGKIKAKHFNNLPESLKRIYKESLIAFNSEAQLLSATGLRSLIEGVCRDKNIEGRNLEKMIDGLAQVLPENIVKNLHSLRFMGNSATHELTPPSHYELRLAIEICEDLLNYLYELDYKTARLGSMNSKHKIKVRMGKPPLPNPVPNPGTEKAAL